MPADFPFNYQPTSTEVKAGAYTIPAGFYGKISNYTSDLTIDTVLAYDPLYLWSETSPSPNVGTGSQSYDYTCPTSGIITSFGFNASDALGVDSQNLVRLYRLSPNGPATLIVELDLGTVFNGTVTSGDIFDENMREIVKGEVLRIEIAYDGGGSAGGFSNGQFFLNIKQDVPNSDLWVPENTDLDGSNYIVTLYPMV